MAMKATAVTGVCHFKPSVALPGGDERRGLTLKAIWQRTKSAAGRAGGAVKSVKPPSMPNVPRWLRVTFAWTVLVIGIAFIVGAGMEFAASGKMAKGVSIDGTSVSGMTRTQARQAIAGKLKPIQGPMELSFEGKGYLIDMKKVDYRVDEDEMIQDAFYVGKRSPGFLRIFRRLFAIPIHKDIPVQATCSKAKLKTVVDGIAEKVNRAPKSASISVATGAVVIDPARLGVRVRVDDTVKALEKSMPTPNRTVNIVADMIQPEIVDSDISKVVWIQQSSFTLTVYNRDQEVNSYKVAVGMPQYPTPNGKFHITYKERNPTWLPTSEWAKDKQGIPQPPGPNNPLGGYWMDLGGGIGIHATPFPKTVGERASHGCIRMEESDAAALFNAVKVGTPVFITD
jgi:lipoprotein-anchoring transpeptidase ErfK/SrfK